VLSSLIIVRTAGNPTNVVSTRRKGVSKVDGLLSHEKMAQELLNYIYDGMKGVNRMFDQQKMTDAVLSLTKEYVNTTMQVMKTSMDQFEKTMDMLSKQGATAHEENQKMWTEWWNKTKQGQQQYWNTMEESIKKMEHIFHSTDGHKRATK